MNRLFLTIILVMLVSLTNDFIPLYITLFSIVKLIECSALMNIPDESLKVEFLTKLSKVMSGSARLRKSTAALDVSY